MSRTYYDVLGVPEDADDAAIQAAYRERVKETHPDLSDDPDASDRFQQVREAKEVLARPDERRRYDRLGHERYVGTEGTAVERETAAETGNRNRDPTDFTEDGHKRRQRARRRHAEARREYQRHRREPDEEGWENGWWERAKTVSETETSRGTSAWATADASAGGAATTGTGRGVGYRVTRTDPPGPQFTPAKLGLAAVTFLLYPVFVVSSLLPAFPFFVNVVVGICTLLLVIYLLSMPETGILVFGGWTLLAPILLTLVGVGLFTPVGFFAWTACWVPCALAVANFVFLSA